MKPQVRRLLIRFSTNHVSASERRSWRAFSRVLLSFWDSAWHPDCWLLSEEDAVRVSGTFGKPLTRIADDRNTTVNRPIARTTSG